MSFQLSYQQQAALFEFAYFMLATIIRGTIAGVFTLTIIKAVFGWP